MPSGQWSKKREREYEELKDKFKDSGRYKGREKEVAARIVNKQRKEYSETKAEKKKDREGTSPDKDLPIKDYQEKTVGEVRKRLDDLSDKEVRQIKRYEEKHKDRKTLKEAIDKRLHDDK